MKKARNNLILKVIGLLFNSFYDFSLSLLKRSKRGFSGFIIVLLFILMAAVGPEVVPYDPSMRPERRFQPASFEHIFGTDYGGRDLFSMIIHGSRNVLIIAFLAGAYTVILGTFIGILSGFKGGKIDDALMFIADFALTIPSVPLILVLAIFIRGVTNPFILAGIVSITSWAGLSRAVRSQTLSLKRRGFIEAASCLGLSTLHIIFKEIIPNMLSYIVVSFLYAVTGAIYASIGLFFLGVLPFDETNWGIILNQSQEFGAFFSPTKEPLLVPILMIVLLQTGLVFLASGFEEFFNPRLRKD
ncbi:MAG: ABC transporter permease [Candidatus Bathyarchaeia archaeon]